MMLGTIQYRNQCGKQPLRHKGSSPMMANDRILRGALGGIVFDALATSIALSLMAGSGFGTP
jgi:hypothetical protein